MSGIDHIKLLNDIGTVERIDYIVSRNYFKKSFVIFIQPREVGGGSIMVLVGKSIQIFTYDSLLNGAVNGGIFSESIVIRKCKRLPDHRSVFQAEVTAIQAS